MTDKPPSERRLIAERFAAFIIENRLANPFGGDVYQDETAKGKPYGVDFSVPVLLDGSVVIYGPKFIQFRMRGRLAHGDGRVFDSEKNALDFLRLSLVEHKVDEALNIPTKAPRAS